MGYFIKQIDNGKDQRRRRARALLPAPVALEIPDYVIAFLDNPQNTADLKEIKFKELAWALHICITDACLTLDCMTMMLSAAIRDDMRGV